MSETSLFAGRRNALAFWLGSAVVTVGVVLHLPMFWMGRNMGFVLAGMPMDTGMLWGMALIVAGIALPAMGCCRRRRQRPESHETIAPPEDAPLTEAPIGC